MKLQQVKTTATITFINGRTVEVSGVLSFQDHVNNASKLNGVESVQSSDGSRIHFIK